MLIVTLLVRLDVGEHGAIHSSVKGGFDEAPASSLWRSFLSRLSSSAFLVASLSVRAALTSLWRFHNSSIVIFLNSLWSMTPPIASEPGAGAASPRLDGVLNAC